MHQVGVLVQQRTAGGLGGAVLDENMLAPDFAASSHPNAILGSFTFFLKFGVLDTIQRVYFRDFVMFSVLVGLERSSKCQAFAGQYSRRTQNRCFINNKPLCCSYPGIYLDFVIFSI